MTKTRVAYVLATIAAVAGGITHLAGAPPIVTGIAVVVAVAANAAAHELGTGSAS